MFFGTCEWKDFSLFWGIQCSSVAKVLFWGGKRVFRSTPVRFFSFGVASRYFPLRQRFFSLFWGGERVFPSAPTLFFSFGVASGCLPLALPFALRRRFFWMVGEGVFPSVDGFMVSPTREPMSIMMGSQIHGPGDLWIHGFMVSRIRESRGSWDLLMAGIHGFMDSWIHGWIDELID